MRPEEGRGGVDAVVDFALSFHPVGPAPVLQLTAPQPGWMDQMTNKGNETLTTEFFNGSSVHYLMALPTGEPVTYFWCVLQPATRTSFLPSSHLLFFLSSLSGLCAVVSLGFTLLLTLYVLKVFS